MSFSCLGPSGSPSLLLYWLPLPGHSYSATQQDNGSTTDLAQTPTVLCSSSDWCSSWGSTGLWACTSARSSTRTGIQDPRSNPAAETNQRFLLCLIPVSRSFGIFFRAKAIYHETRPTSGLVEHGVEGWSSRIDRR